MRAAAKMAVLAAAALALAANAAAQEAIGTLDTVSHTIIRFPLQMIAPPRFPSRLLAVAAPRRPPAPTVSAWTRAECATGGGTAPTDRTRADAVSAQMRSPQ